MPFDPPMVRRRQGLRFELHPMHLANSTHTCHCYHASEVVCSPPAMTPVMPPPNHVLLGYKKVTRVLDAPVSFLSTFVLHLTALSSDHTDHTRLPHSLTQVTHPLVLALTIHHDYLILSIPAHGFSACERSRQVTTTAIWSSASTDIFGIQPTLRVAA